MGRIRSTAVKRVGKKLFETNRDKLMKDFDQNKQSVAELVEYKSKKLRNVLAGYMTKLAKSGTIKKRKVNIE
ncbi:MAG: 30S ribosomal protein S17e [Nanoarchaeota archaeon]|nr:30S ribosomal protein S17e [Nanoarchaeota archaeon]